MPISIPKTHVIMCASSRIAGVPKGGCQGRGATDLVQYMQEEANDRGIEDILVTNTGCLQICPRGPIAIVYPAGNWYGRVDSEEKVDEILDAIEAGTVVEHLLLENTAEEPVPA